MDLLEQLGDKILVGDGCWEWQASRDSKGYGQLGGTGSERGTLRRAHRVVYELLVGPIPDGLDLDHLCRVKHCVRPGHLEPVTRRENLRRGIGPVAANMAKIHCPQGHPYAGGNLYVAPRTGVRRCRVCRRDADERRQERRRSA